MNLAALLLAVACGALRYGQKDACDNFSFSHQTPTDHGTFSQHKRITITLITNMKTRDKVGLNNRKANLVNKI